LGASDYWLWAQRKKERVKGAALEEKGKKKAKV